MWIVREGISKMVGQESTQLAEVRVWARAQSEERSNMFEVVSTELNTAVFIYIHGREYALNDGSLTTMNNEISDDTEAFGKRIWLDLVFHEEYLFQLLKKLKLSTHEQNQFGMIQDRVLEREAELRFILTDIEYQCAYYTYVESAIDSRSISRPNYCDRQIRRYVKRALIKTGQVAFVQGWKPITLRNNVGGSKTENHRVDSSSGVM